MLATAHPTEVLTNNQFAINRYPIRYCKKMLLPPPEIARDADTGKAIGLRVLGITFLVKVLSHGYGPETPNLIYGRTGHSDAAQARDVWQWHAATRALHPPQSIFPAKSAI